MKSLKIEPINAEAFAPFGRLLPPVPPGSGRQELIEELQNDRASARPRLSIATTEPKALPLTAVEMERHVHSSQAFAPLDCASYLVMVAPHGEGGLPDLEKRSLPAHHPKPSAPPRYLRPSDGSFFRRMNSAHLINSYPCQRGSLNEQKLVR